MIMCASIWGCSANAQLYVPDKQNWPRDSVFLEICPSVPRSTSIFYPKALGGGCSVSYMDILDCNAEDWTEMYAHFAKLFNKSFREKLRSIGGASEQFILSIDPPYSICLQSKMCEKDFSWTCFVKKELKRKSESDVQFQNAYYLMRQDFSSLIPFTRAVSFEMDTYDDFRKYMDSYVDYLLSHGRGAYKVK